MHKINFNEKIEELMKEPDALKSSLALNKILHMILIENKKEKLVLLGIIILMIILMFCEGIGMAVYCSQFETEETTTSTETTYSFSEASGENAAINNVQGDQYNDQATRNNYYKE